MILKINLGTRLLLTIVLKISLQIQEEYLISIPTLSYEYKKL